MEKRIHAMNRRTFHQYSLKGLGTIMSLSLSQLYQQLSDQGPTERMPVLFVGHGNPLNAIQDNSFSRQWKELGDHLPRPKAILSVSAHWLTRGKTLVDVSPQPKTIHDFGGFPQKLFDQQYPAPGSPELAQLATELIHKTHVQPDQRWGLDHGTWSVLLPMYPAADIPVFQLSIDYAQPPRYHYELAKELQQLREKGVLILGSGNVVHNLGQMNFQGLTPDWAKEFDQYIQQALDQDQPEQLIDFQKLGTLAKIAHPTIEHYLPLMYAIAQRDSQDQLTYFNEGWDGGSISMRSFVLS